MKLFVTQLVSNIPTDKDKILGGRKTFFIFFINDTGNALR